MEQKIKPTSRKKFLLWSGVLLSSFTVLNFISTRKKEKNETVKMLTEDGKLVEIDKKLLTSNSKKITDNELKAWVKNDHLPKNQTY